MPNTAPMTTADHATGRPKTDWKVTTGHRVLTGMGFLAVVSALYGAMEGMVTGMDSAWWAAAGMAAFALLVGGFMPAPVPRELLTGRRTHIDAPRPDDD